MTHTAQLPVQAPARSRITIEGIVQGVGFRPSIYKLARSLRLSGYVLNNGRGVEIEVEGTPDDIGEFLLGLPPLND